jgi:hypothetical protein
MKTMIYMMIKLYLWLFKRKEWKLIGEQIVGKRRIFFDTPSPMCDLIEKTWEHPAGYIIKNKWMR